MRQREDTDRRSTPWEAPEVPRKPYQKPAVRHERVFETSALHCGKVQDTGPNCKNNRMTS